MFTVSPSISLRFWADFQWLRDKIPRTQCMTSHSAAWQWESAGIQEKFLETSPVRSSLPFFYSQTRSWDEQSHFLQVLVATVEFGFKCLSFWPFSALMALKWGQVWRTCSAVWSASLLGQVGDGTSFSLLAMRQISLLCPVRRTLTSMRPSTRNLFLSWPRSGFPLWHANVVIQDLKLL